MLVFSVLWLPLFYLFRRSSQEKSGTGGVWALLAGSVVALIQFFLGDMVHPGGFGFSRWLYSFVDIVALPVLIPLLLYLPFVIFRKSTQAADYANFTLLYLIPGAGIRAVGWSSTADPVLLVLVPLLWTTIAVGIPFFFGCIMTFYRWFARIPSVLGILILPFLASASWWAFYSQRFWPGIIFLALSALPLLFSVVLSWKKTGLAF